MASALTPIPAFPPLDPEEAAAEQRSVMIEHANQKIAALVVATYPKIELEGLTPATLRYFEKVVQALNEGDALADNVLEALAKAKSPELEGTDELPLLPAAHLVAIADGVFKKVQKATATFRDTTATPPLVANARWSEPARRTRLARLCIRSGLDEGQGALEWEELNMIAMCFDDQLTHFRLAEALLDGDPKKIEDKASMDTATRENLDNRVWDFVCNGLKGLESVKLVRRKTP